VTPRVHDPSPDEQRFELPAQGLDLRQLRH
jgi:hypothetical protein